ncbi:hypothetical protein SEA_A3WALLY_264 [Microbacterium phage A3Wally]|nr:hypothetical protein SEA_A3WALLY_264 [Microbacterium phage A3Wally]
MQRKFIRNPKIRLWLALSIPLLGTLGGTIWIPGAWEVWLYILAVPVGLAALVVVICVVIAFIYWVRTGYITNPLRHGPWGDWKHRENSISW